MKIAIFGAGISGLMAALLLTQQGHECEVFERSQASLTDGMGFIVMPSGVDCFYNFGIELKKHNHYANLHHYYHRDKKGIISSEHNMPKGALGFRRQELIDILVGSLSVPIHFDACLEHYVFDEAGRATQAMLSCGKIIEADLFVAADGVRSVARKKLFPNANLDYARVFEVVGITNFDSKRFWANGSFNKFHDPKGGLAFGILPVDLNQIVWYVQFDKLRFGLPDSHPDHPSTKAFIKHLLQDWAEPIPEIVDSTPESAIHLWRPVDVDLIPRFHHNNLVLIGDAAHPLLPFTSQGVSSAVADVVCLIEELNRHQQLDHALTQYSSKRHKQCAQYVQQGRLLTERFLHPQKFQCTDIPIAK